MRFVRDDHHVAPVRQRRIVRPAPGRSKLLNGGEYDSARSPVQRLLQVLTALRLNWRLTDQVAVHGEGAEQLIVKVVTVGHDNDGRVLQFRSSNQLARVERHEQALAGTLGVPDHAHLAVAFGRGSTHRAFHGVSHGVILMIARDDLGNARSGIAKDREIADQIEKPPLFEHPLDQHGHLGTAL